MFTDMDKKEETLLYPLQNTSIRAIVFVQHCKVIVPGHRSNSYFLVCGPERIGVTRHR